MRTGLVTGTIFTSIAGAVLSEISLFRMFTPPDNASAFLAGAWLAVPYLAAAVLALLVRHRHGAMVTLFVTLLLSGAIGVWLLNSAATQSDVSQQQVRDAVQPGEDPNAGPGGMRKSGAEAGAAIGGAFSILMVLVLPPVQLGTVLLPTMIAFAFSKKNVGNDAG